ncbi:type II toxin-antitoxin system VapB family antitoxin [Georgenia sp. Z1491]|uniref:type II toxin-antitoxin system VapB family antitoxin n=1 Tax=Georgenia sp. Z1491 TaxID=3416707 RepID=UPI003CE778D2
MGLNIKNERVHALAREAARVTGKTQTSAIEEALERLLTAHGEDPARARAQERMRRVRSIVAEYAELPVAPAREGRVTEVDDLYDEVTGLPR